MIVRLVLNRAFCGTVICNHDNDDGDDDSYKFHDKYQHTHTRALNLSFFVIFFLFIYGSCFLEGLRFICYGIAHTIFFSLVSID